MRILDSETCPSLMANERVVSEYFFSKSDANKGKNALSQESVCRNDEYTLRISNFFTQFQIFSADFRDAFYGHAHPEKTLGHLSCFRKITFIIRWLASRCRAGKRIPKSQIWMAGVVFQDGDSLLAAALAEKTVFLFEKMPCGTSGKPNSMPSASKLSLIQVVRRGLSKHKMPALRLGCLLIPSHPPCISPAVSNMGDMSAKAGSSVLLTMPWGLPQA